MSPSVSVIIPTYGRRAYLREALRSVLDQTVTDLECIVVDDASPEPVEVPDDPRVRLIRRQVNGGVAAARNDGIDAARGRYVTFLDDDDLLTPDRLEIGFEAAERAPIGVCRLAVLDDPTTGPIHELEGDVSASIAAALVPNVGQALVPRELMVPFDPSLRACEDVDWWLRMTEGVKLATAPRVGYLFREHTGLRHANDLATRAQLRQVVIDKHRAYFDEHPDAEAFQLFRIGMAMNQIGSGRAARRPLLRSLRLDPRFGTLRQLVSSYGLRRPTHAPPDVPQR